jgi:hypothetical protein
MLALCSVCRLLHDGCLFRLHINPQNGSMFSETSVDFLWTTEHCNSDGKTLHNIQYGNFDLLHRVTIFVLLVCGALNGNVRKYMHVASNFMAWKEVVVADM